MAQTDEFNLRFGEFSLHPASSISDPVSSHCPNVSFSEIFAEGKRIVMKPEKRILMNPDQRVIMKPHQRVIGMNGWLSVLQELLQCVDMCSVTVSRLTIKDTIEDRILALQEDKRCMVASAFGEDQSGWPIMGNRLTVDDIRFLFGA